MIFCELVENICIKQEVITPDFDENFDVIVAGLGSAGAFLALCASEKCSVLAIEKSNSVGGTCTNGFVCSYYHGLTGGLYEKIDKEAYEKSDIYRRGINNPYAKSDCLYKNLKESGNITLAFESVIIGVYEDKNTVAGVKALIDGKVKNIACSFLCDCTADGHILRILGADYSVGRENDGVSAPFSVNKYFRENGEIKSIGADAGYINQYDAGSFSDSVLRAKAGFTKEKYRRIISCAPMVGLREGLRFGGEYTLTLDDAVYEKNFEKVLFYADSDIDRHGEDHYLGSDTWKDWYIRCNLSTVSLKIPVPAECLVPKGKNGIISACRCLSADSYIASAVRMNRDMHRLGECAGIAVAQAVKTGKTNILDVDFKELQSVLKARGCFDSDINRHRGFEEKGGKYYPFDWLTQKDDIIKTLSTNRPGAALWSCKLLGKEKAKEYLEEALDSDNAMLRKNAAIALGITGNDICFPVLRDMIENRTDDFLDDCRRSNQMQSLIALSLCAGFADEKTVKELCSILEPEEYEKEMYHSHLENNYRLSTYADFNMIYFQFLSFTLFSLKEICDDHSEMKAKIAKKVNDFIGNKDVIYDRIVLNKNKKTYSNQAEALFSFARQLVNSCVEQ